jgi:hypothetical protein
MKMELVDVGDQCPTCGTGVNKINHKALCAHVMWIPAKRKRMAYGRKWPGGWVRRRTERKDESAQEQKYKIVPAWRAKKGVGGK